MAWSPSTKQETGPGHCYMSPTLRKSHQQPSLSSLPAGATEPPLHFPLILQSTTVTRGLEAHSPARGAALFRGLAERSSLKCCRSWAGNKSNAHHALSAPLPLQSTPRSAAGFFPTHKSAHVQSLPKTLGDFLPNNSQQSDGTGPCPRTSPTPTLPPSLK